MAGSAGLSGGTRLRFAALLALVLLLHLLALHWLARQLAPVSLLQPLPQPMFTRLLRPEAPAAVPPAPPAPVVHRRPSRPAITSLTKQAAPATPAGAQSAASAPEAAESAQPAALGAEAAESAQPAAVAPESAESAQPAAASAPENAGSRDSAAATAAASSPTGSTATAAPGTASAAGPVPGGPDAAATSAGPTTAPAVTANAPASAPASNTGLDSWPVDTRLNYRLGGYFRGDLHGSAKVQWQRQNDRYQTRVEVDLTLLASLVMTSQGQVTAQGLWPRAYEEARRSGPRGVRLGDDAITLNDGRSVPRPPGVQDTASQFVELSHRFASGQDRLEVGRSVSLWMARPGAVDLWTYDIVAREMLQTPELGAIEAFHLKPRPIANPRGNITAEMWFAPSLRYLPVRIRVNMGESTYVDLLVENIEQR